MSEKEKQTAEKLAEAMNALPIRKITALSVRQYNAICNPKYGKIG